MPSGSFGLIWEGLTFRRLSHINAITCWLHSRDAPKLFCRFCYKYLFHRRVSGESEDEVEVRGRYGQISFSLRSEI